MKEIFSTPQVAFAHGIHQNNKTTLRQPEVKKKVDKASVLDSGVTLLC